MPKSWWDEFKDLFKTDEQKAYEKQEKINSALQAENDVVNKLKELEDEYNATLPKDEEYNLEELFPSNSGLEEIVYTPRTDEDIVSSAQKEIAVGKQGALADLTSKYDEAKAALDDGKASAKSNLQQSYENLANLYNDLKTRAENDALKRGMARSSVITSQLSDLSKAHMDAVSEQEVAYQKVVGDIENKIASLQNDRENALEQLDLKYAMQLDKRIEELKKERDKTVLEYEKYNQSVREQNAKYAKDREEDIADFLAQKEKEKVEAQKAQSEYESKYGYNGEKQDNYAKRYQIAFDFYTSLSPEIALDALNASPNMKYYLGAYYNRLVNALTNYSGGESQKRYF